MNYPSFHSLRALISKNSQLFLLFIIFAVVRFLFAFIFPVFSDACRYFLIAKALADNPLLLFRPGLSYPPPLFPLVAALFYTIFKNFGLNAANLSLRLISPIFGSATIPLIYSIARKIFSDKKVALYSTIFLGLSPVHILFSSIGYFEGIYIFLSSLAIYLILRNNATKSIIYCGIALGLACLTKQSGPFLVLLFSLYIILFKKMLLRRRFKQFLFLIIIVLIVVAPYYARNFYEFGNPVMSWPFPQLIAPRTKVESVDSFFVIPTEKEDSLTNWEISRAIGGQNGLLLEFVSPYFEYWGVWGGRISSVIRLSYTEMPNSNPHLLLLGFTAITVILSSIIILGVLNAVGSKCEGETFIRFLLIAFILFWLFAAIRLKLEGTSLFHNWGYRVIAPLTSVLTIYAGLGMKQFGGLIKSFQNPKLVAGLRALIIICLVLCAIGVAIEGIYLTRYFSRLDHGISWIQANTVESAVILTSRPSEVAYLTGRRTVNILNLNPSLLSPQLLSRYSISYILLTYNDPLQGQPLQPYLDKIKGLESAEIIKLVYVDKYASIFKIVN